MHRLPSRRAHRHRERQRAHRGGRLLRADGRDPYRPRPQQAAEDLGTEGNRTILLVSDGIATCDPDPCEVAEELTADGFDLVVHTVGLGVDDATRSQLQCIADAAGGTYYDGTDTDSLTTALTRISTRAFRPFTITGEPVQGTTAPRTAPTLGPGQYVDTMAHQQAQYYLVERTGPGASLHVGATMRPQDPSGTSAFDLKLETLDGGSCDWDVVRVWSAGAGNTFGSGDVTGYADARDPEDPCGTDDQLLLSITEQSGSNLGGHPVEIWVHEEPATADLTGLPDNQADALWQGVEIGDPVGEVVGGTSFTDATLLEAGATYSSDIVPGEILVFSVPVDWGQHLETVVEFPQPDPALGEHIGPSGTWAEVGFYGPDRGEAVSRLSDTGEIRLKEQVTARGRALAGGLTYDVEWNNRRWGSPHAADRPGDYYVVLSMGSSRNDAVPVPFTITNEVVGEVFGAPTYVDPQAPPEDSAPVDGAGTTTAGSAGPDEDGVAATDAAATAAQGAGTDTDGADAQTEAPGAATDRPTGTGPDERDSSPLVWVLSGLGILLAGAGAFLLGRRRA